ncbi:MAG TPA: hypothetical protein VM694_36440, partial [Polyangium sp.]|nr:hypothetical protein [Polyangium sp.]
ASSGLPPVDAPVLTPQGPDGSGDTTTGTREPFLKWYTHKPLAWVGSGVAVIGLGLGIGFSIGASVASGKADQHAAEIRTFASTDPSTNFGKNPPCGSTETSGSDLPNYEQACGVLRKDLSDYDTNVAVATTGWVLFGVGAIGTGVYALLDWYLPKKSSTSTTSSNDGPRVLAVSPSVSSTYQGLGVVGTF